MMYIWTAENDEDLGDLIGRPDGHEPYNSTLIGRPDGHEWVPEGGAGLYIVYYHKCLVVIVSYPYQFPVSKATRYGRDFVPYCISKNFRDISL